MNPDPPRIARRETWLALAAILATIGVGLTGVGHEHLDFPFDLGIAGIVLAIASLLWMGHLILVERRVNQVRCPDPSAHASEAVRTATLLGVLRDIEAELDKSTLMLIQKESEEEGWLPAEDLSVTVWKANAEYLRRQTGIQSILYPLNQACKYVESLNARHAGQPGVLDTGQTPDGRSVRNAVGSARMNVQQKIWEIDNDPQWLPGRTRPSPP